MTTGPSAVSTDRAAILAIAERKMADLYVRDIRAIVDLTAVDLGRDISLIVDVARRSRVRVIVAAGVWWMPDVPGEGGNA